MQTSRAVRIDGAGGVEVLSIVDHQVRDPGPGEVRVQVAAAGLNRADILQRRGFYPAPKGVVADVPGLEYSGTVEAVGEGVTDWQPGQRVMAIAGGGAMAEYIVAHERELIAVPDGLDLHHAAAVPEVFLTAYDALSVQGGMAMGDNVLLHSVGSGVGTAALQLALASGARPIGTSRTHAKLDRCTELGLVDAVCVTDATFAPRVAELTGGAGADIILDTVGAAYLEQNVKALAKRGRLIVVGLLGGVKGMANLGALLAKRATIVGTVLRSRSLEEKIALAQRFAKHVVPLLAAGKLRPIVDDVMPMQDVAAAHQRMESNETFGKLVLRW